ncbi:MAG: DUF4250 domain-containing protein [Lachnospiraceae bacterium]|nr:DUF4250 domain-containing protein [Lachnospiraceae bacterium]
MPKDPNMLLSFVNTQLRDNYENLEDLASAYGTSPEDISDRLASIGYTYDEALKRFITK